MYGTNVNIISVSDFQAYAPEIDVSQYSAPTMSGIITQASSMVANYLQYTPVAEDITNELKEAFISTDGDLLVYPAKLPIISVSSLKIAKGATELAITLTETDGTAKYNVDFARRNLRFPWGEVVLQGTAVFNDFYSLRGQQFYTKMSYRGGWEAYAIPDDIKLATILYTRELISKRNNTSGAQSITQGGISLRFSDRTEKSDLVKDAERLLGPYRRIG